MRATFNLRVRMPPMDAQEARATLNVGQGATRREIKAAYRRLALEHHPDKGSADGGRRFQAISEAYGVLKDGGGGGGGGKERPDGRRAQQQQRRQRQGPRGPRGRPGGAGGGGPFGDGRAGGRPPEQDWSRYTAEFEEGNPDFWKEYERNFWKEYERAAGGGSTGGTGNGEDEKAREPSAQPNLFVRVDPSLCIACQSCETIAPTVFSIDKNSNLNPKSRVINMRGAGVNKIMNAAETCPTRAISVDDVDSKRRMYPL